MEEYRTGSGHCLSCLLIHWCDVMERVLVGREELLLVFNAVYRYFFASGFFLAREQAGAASEARSIWAGPASCRTARNRLFPRQQSTAIAAFLKWSNKRAGTRPGLLSYTADTRISSHFSAFSPLLLLSLLTNAALCNTAKVVEGKM